jgi:predicted acyl esterase
MWKRQLQISVVAFTFLCLAAFPSPSSAQQTQDPYTRADAMIAMRDGVKLNTHIYTPTRKNEQYPMILLRTPS